MSNSELEALKKDAERYRYLKSQAKYNDEWDMFEIWIGTCEPTSYYRNSFDDAVDLEIREEHPGHE